MISSSSRCDQVPLPQVERMARKLLQDEDVAVVLELCKRHVAEREVESLVRPLLAVLDTPEKLLLLREIRGLVCEEDLQKFNSMVQPYEDEAYSVLKRQSQDVSRPTHLMEQVEHLSVPAPALCPLPDVPVDGPFESDIPKSSTSSFTMPNWLLTENSASNAAPEARSSRRSRAPFCTGFSESRARRNEKELQDGFNTVMTTSHSRRTPLSQVFGPLRRSQSSAAPPVGHQEYELQGVSPS